MFSRPRLGVNTAVYGQVPFEDAIQDILELEVDGFVAKLSPSTSLEDLVAGSAIRLLGIELEAYQFGQLPVNIEDICQISQSIGCEHILLPKPPFLATPTIQEAIQFVEDVQRLADTAVAHNQNIVVDIVNRYESALLNTVAQGENLLKQVDRPNVKLMFNTFDLNIEEQDGASQIGRLGEHLAFLKMSDSNHGAIGEGNIKLASYLWTVQEMAHQPPVLLDVKRPYPSPFTPQQSETPVQELLKKSRSWF